MFKQGFEIIKFCLLYFIFPNKLFIKREKINDYSYTVIYKN